MLSLGAVVNGTSVEAKSLLETVAATEVVVPILSRTMFGVWADAVLKHYPKLADRRTVRQCNRRDHCTHQPYHTVATKPFSDIATLLVSDGFECNSDCNEREITKVDISASR